jgi:small-conductance mechanosensitive channel
MSFEDYGMRLEVRFWIADPMNGVNNVRSDVNRSIWRVFRARGIKIPVAQRELRVLGPPSDGRDLSRMLSDAGNDDDSDERPR